MTKNSEVTTIFKGRTLIIATMHGKESIVAPILKRELGVKSVTLKDFNTEVFGTFSGEIERKETPGVTLKAKALAALADSNETLVFASEGSFGPHPSYFFIPANEEMVILLDKQNDLEIMGRYFTENTNFNSREIYTMQDLEEFASLSGFPEHGIILKSTNSVREKEVWKDFMTLEDLITRAGQLFEKGQKIWAETDMRAMNNPTRMIAIEQAVINLVQNIKSLCPTCNTPGFVVDNVIRGLPCGTCTLPTKSIKTYIYFCKKCKYSIDKFKEGNSVEDPMYCDFCNP